MTLDCEVLHVALFKHLRLLCLPSYNSTYVKTAKLSLTFAFTVGSLATLSFTLFSLPVASFGFLSLGKTLALEAVAPNAIFSLDGLLPFLTGFTPTLLLLSLSSLSGNFGIPYFLRMKLI